MTNASESATAAASTTAARTAAANTTGSNAAVTGRQLRNAMFGEELTTAQLTAGDPMFERLQEIVSRTCFGETWSRPELSLRDRSIATVAMLIALGREPELRTHIRGALSNGVTPTEIREIAIHSYLYAGLPAAFGGAAAANAVFTAAEKEELA